MKKAIFLLFIPVLVDLLNAEETFINKANDMYKQGMFEKAIRNYKKALATGENPALIYFNLGNTYYQMDNLPKAITAYEAAIREAPDFFRTYLNLGIIYFNLEDWPLAISALERGRKIEPENKQLVLVLALAYKNMDEMSEAVPFLEYLIDSNAGMDECYFQLYEIFISMGDTISALRIMHTYPDSGNRVADKFQLLGDLAEQEGNLEKACFYFNRLINKDPNRKWAYYRLVKITFADNKKLLALQYAQDALIRFPEFAELALMAGNMAFESRYYLEAVGFYEKAYKLGEQGGLIGLQNILKMFNGKFNPKIAVEEGE